MSALDPHRRRNLPPEPLPEVSVARELPSKELDRNPGALRVVLPPSDVHDAHASRPEAPQQQVRTDAVGVGWLQGIGVRRAVSHDR